MDIEKLFMRLSMLSVALLGLVAVIQWYNGSIPQLLMDFLNLGFDIGTKKITVQAVAGVLTLYMAGLYWKTRR